MTESAVTRGLLLAVSRLRNRAIDVSLAPDHRNANRFALLYGQLNIRHAERETVG